MNNVEATLCELMNHIHVCRGEFPSCRVEVPFVLSRVGLAELKSKFTYLQFEINNTPIYLAKLEPMPPHMSMAC